MLRLKEAIADMRHLQPFQKAPQDLLYPLGINNKRPGKNVYALAEFTRDYNLRRRLPVGNLVIGFIHAVEKEVELRKDQLRGKRKDRKERSPLHSFARSEFTLHRDLDLANRMANQLVDELVSKDHEFNEHFFESRENTEYSDHNFEHLRRVELFSKTFAINSVDGRVDTPINQFMPAMILAAQFHDADQSLQIHGNHVRAKEIEKKMRGDGAGEEVIKEEVKKSMFEVKKGHCEAGAVMVLTLYKDYARVNGITESEAWKICSEAALMILKHDKLEFFNKAISSENSAENMDDATLIEAYRNHNVDLFTLSPKQLIYILKEEKKYKQPEGRFVNKNSPHGLVPSFEQLYAPILNQLETDDRILFDQRRFPQVIDDVPFVNNDRYHEQLRKFERLTTLESGEHFIDTMPVVDEGYKKSYIVATQIFMFADTSDMVTPAVDGFFRSLRTQYSMERPFMRPGLTREELDELVDLITLTPEQFAVKKWPDISEESVLNSKRKEIEARYNTDVYRKLYESCHFADPLLGSELEKSRHIVRFKKDAAMMNALSTRKFGQLLMDADQNMAAEKIKEAYDARITGLREKALGKTDAVVSWQREAIKKSSDFEIAQMIYYLGDMDLATRYFAKAVSIRKEMFMLLDSLQSTEKKIEYTNEDRQNFMYVTDSVITRLRELYHVTDEEMKKYAEYVDKGELPQTLPYGRYDSLSAHTGTRKVTGRMGAIFRLDDYFKSRINI